MLKECLIRVWMIRHGQTTWNETGRCLGRSDIILSLNGRQSVKSLANCIDVSQCDVVFCSPYKRAIETAGLLLVKTSQTPIICEELREIDFGIWEGMPWKEIIEKRYAEWNAWENDPFLSNPYNGESLSDAEERIKRLYSRLLRENLGQTVLLVGHGGILNIFLCFLFQLPLQVIWTFKLRPASFSEVLICTDGPVLTTLNYGPNIPTANLHIGNIRDGISQSSVNLKSLALV